MSLPQFLQLGMARRREAGIDGLERVLTRSAANPAQQPLRDHALQALRRAQQRLLLRLLHQVPAGGKGADDPARMVAALMRKLKVGARAAAPGDDAAGLEHAVLDVWALSDAASSVADPV
jgi:glutamate dehydrogenase